MNNQIKFISLLAVLFSFLIVFPNALQADTKEQIRERMKKRFPEIQMLKKDNKIGETYLGLVAIISNKDTAKVKIKLIVTAENNDRKMLYELIAKAQKTTPEVVAKTNAMRIFKKAKPKEMFKNKKDVWQQKKDIKRKPKN